MNQKKLAILLIATGPYTVFWVDFYKSFERNFLKNTEVHYYIFTDADSELFNKSNHRVHVYYKQAEPWPIPTLMKFHTFLTLKDELLQYDYLYQSNINMICVKEVKEEDFLPRSDKGETLFFTLHPGYFRSKKETYPYERCKDSMAYIPYNKGGRYTFGAMNGGVAEAYLQMAEQLDERIAMDLKHNRIAVHHDESHINRYVCTCDTYRLLSYSYCYPEGWNLPDECYIQAVDKARFFDVYEFKESSGVKGSERLACKIVRHANALIKNILMRPLKQKVMVVIDTIFEKNYID